MGEALAQVVIVTRRHLEVPVSNPTEECCIHYFDVFQTDVDCNDTFAANVAFILWGVLLLCCQKISPNVMHLIMM